MGVLSMVYLVSVSPQSNNVVITTSAFEGRKEGLRGLSSSPKITQPVSRRSESNPFTHVSFTGAHKCRCRGAPGSGEHLLLRGRVLAYIGWGRRDRGILC